MKHSGYATVFNVPDPVWASPPVADMVGPSPVYCPVKVEQKI